MPHFSALCVVYVVGDVVVDDCLTINVESTVSRSPYSASHKVFKETPENV